MSCTGISLVPRPSRGGGKAWYTLCVHVRNYSEIYVREQWVCIKNVIINCTRVFEIRKEVYCIHCSSAVKRRKEGRAALSLLHGPCASQALLLTKLSFCSVAVESESFCEIW